MKVQFNISDYFSDECVVLFGENRRKLKMVHFIKDLRSNVGDLVPTSEGNVNSFGLKAAKDVCDTARNHYMETGLTVFVLDSETYPALQALNGFVSFHHGRFGAVKPFSASRHGAKELLKESAKILIDLEQYDDAERVLAVLFNLK